MSVSAWVSSQISWNRCVRKRWLKPLARFSNILVGSFHNKQHIHTKSNIKGKKELNKLTTASEKMNLTYNLVKGLQLCATLWKFVIVLVFSEYMDGGY